MPTHPYCSQPGRLGDVLAAIQVMASYKYHKLSIARWAERIDGGDKSTEHWQRVFAEHGEFFRFGDKQSKVSLAWRRSTAKNFHVDTLAMVSKAELAAMSRDERKRVSRAPLSHEQVQTLLTTAMGLHQAALAQQKERRWWVPILAGLAGIALGALLKA